MFTHGHIHFILQFLLVIPRYLFSKVGRISSVNLFTCSFLSRAIHCRRQAIHLFRHKQIFGSILSKFTNPMTSKIISQSNLIQFFIHDRHMELLVPYHIHRSMKHRQFFFFQHDFNSIGFKFIHHVIRIDLSF